jgi:hypothetical protein
MVEGMLASVEKRKSLRAWRLTNSDRSSNTPTDGSFGVGDRCSLLVIT